MLAQHPLRKLWQGDGRIALVLGAGRWRPVPVSADVIPAHGLDGTASLARDQQQLQELALIPPTLFANAHSFMITGSAASRLNQERSLGLGAGAGGGISAMGDLSTRPVRAHHRKRVLR